MWQAFIPLIGTVLDKLFPDPAKANEAKLELLRLQQQGALAELDADVKLALAQATTNTAEAANPSIFVSGWRPGAGWACVLGLVYQFLLQPLLPWLTAVCGVTVPELPAIDSATLTTLLMGLLGLGGLRTFERAKGVARES